MTFLTDMNVNCNLTREEQVQKNTTGRTFSSFSMCLFIFFTKRRINVILNQKPLSKLPKDVLENS